MEYFFKCIFAFLIALAVAFGVVFGAMWACGVVLTDSSRGTVCFFILLIGSVISAALTADTVDRY
jgi:uncharacterized protein (DUF697 family)